MEILSFSNKTKTYRVTLNEGAVVVVKANTYYCSDVLTYCFTNEEHMAMEKLLVMGKAPSVVYEIPKRYVFAIELEGSVTVIPPPAPPVKPKQPRKKKTEATKPSVEKKTVQNKKKS